MKMSLLHPTIRSRNSVLVSVIIPTLNEEKYIQKLLMDIINNTLPATEYEIIVADSGSTDMTQKK